MKSTIIQTLFIIIVGLCVNLMHARATVTIRNEYRTAIILLMNDKEVKRIEKNETFTLPLSSLGAQFKIKAEGSLISHSGIQKEIDKASLMQGGTCIITIPNTYGPHFEYKPSCSSSTILEEFRSNPNKTNFVRLINAIDKGLILTSLYKDTINRFQASPRSADIMQSLFNQFQTAAQESSNTNQFETKLKQHLVNMSFTLSGLLKTFKDHSNEINFVQLIDAIDKGLILTPLYKIAVKLIRASSKSQPILKVLLTQLQSDASSISDLQRFETKLKQRLSHMIDHLNTLFSINSVTFRNDQLQNISSKLSNENIGSFLEATLKAIDKDAWK